MNFEDFIKQFHITPKEVEELWDYLQMIRQRQARKYIAKLLKRLPPQP